MKSFMESNKPFKGTSMSIQNDLLTSIESTVMDHLKHEIQLVDFVSFQVDEASDICSKEYVSIVMRYALQDGPVERFLGFFNIRQRNAEGIFQIIKEALDSYECDYRKIVSITCDGASVMSGSVNGVAMKMKELNSSIFSVHCHAHKLNLVISDTVKSLLPVRTFFSSISAFRSFFHRSTKRNDILDDFLKEHNKKQRRIPVASETRWTYGSRTVTSILDLHSVLCDCFSYIKTCDRFKDDTSHVAIGLLNLLKDSRFIFLCSLWKRIFLTTDILSKMCQKIETDVLQCSSQLNQCIKS